MPPSHSDNLDTRLRELETAIEELQDELQSSERSFNLTRPPSPRALLRATDEVAIPALILTLETSIKALELTQRAIRLANQTQHQSDSNISTANLRAETLTQLDRIITEFRSLLDDDLPQETEAREIITQARALRDEIATNLDESIPGDRATDQSKSSDPNSVGIDVDAELESIKNELNTDQPDTSQ